jgi:hypothetical protein
MKEGMAAKNRLIKRSVMVILKLPYKRGGHNDFFSGSDYLTGGVGDEYIDEKGILLSLRFRPVRTIQEITP